MNVQITTENCNVDQFYLVEEAADSAVTLTIDYPKIVSMQSRKALIDNAIATIQQQLSKFQWIISGPVFIDMTWYLDAVQRQETDAIGDIDNVTKPIQDALCGPNGILIDDSQIKGLYSFWITRNDLLNDNVLTVTIKFNNDFALMKNNLFFVQYYQAVCIPVSIDFTKNGDMLAAAIIIKARVKARKTAARIKTLGSNADNYLVLSNYDFHRTRLNQFSSKVISIQTLKQRCVAAGLNLNHFRNFYRKRPIDA